MGRMQMLPEGNISTLSFPNCNFKSKNKTVSHLSFYVSDEDVYISQVRITYQNGTQDVVDVDNEFTQNTYSNWYSVGVQARCVTSISVQGMSLAQWLPWPLVWWIHRPKNRNPPGKPIIVPQQPSTLTFIGYKAQASKGGF